MHCVWKRNKGKGRIRARSPMRRRRRRWWWWALCAFSPGWSCNFFFRFTDSEKKWSNRAELKLRGGEGRKSHNRSAQPPSAKSAEVLTPRLCVGWIMRRLSGPLYHFDVSDGQGVKTCKTERVRTCCNLIFIVELNLGARHVFVTAVLHLN